MAVLQICLLAVLAVTVAATGSVEKFSGYIQFYRDVNLKHLLATMMVYRANRCYNFAGCGNGNLNDAVSSVEWKGLPTTATYEGGTNAQVAFYADSDCTGTSESFPTKWGGVQAFSARSFNDVVSSFMILQYSTGIENGTHRICELETENALITTTTMSESS